MHLQENKCFLKEQTSLQRPVYLLPLSEAGGGCARGPLTPSFPQMWLWDAQVALCTLVKVHVIARPSFPFPGTETHGARVLSLLGLTLSYEIQPYYLSQGCTMLLDLGLDLSAGPGNLPSA